MLEYNQFFINNYKLDTCKIIDKLQELAQSGIENYYDDVEFWLLFDTTKSTLMKRSILSAIFFPNQGLA